MPVHTSAQSSQRVYGDPIFMYYTAKTIAGAAITTVIQDGYAFFHDYANFVTTGAGGLGQCVTQAVTANLSYFAGVAINVPPGFTGPGWIQVVPCGWGITAYTKSTQVIGASSTFLGGVTGQWYLGTIADASVTTWKQAAAICAQSLNATDTNTTPANVPVLLRPFAGI